MVFVPRLISSACSGRASPRRHGVGANSYGVIRCLSWSSRSHWSLACSPPPSLSEKIFDVMICELSKTTVGCYILLAAGWLEGKLPNQLLPAATATGPPAGRQRRGSGRGVSAERIPRGTPPNLARRGEVVTKTQELRPTMHMAGLGNNPVQVFAT
jgi:hypothetical protein